MTVPEAIGRLVAGQPVYRWNDFTQRWSRVIAITYDRPRRSHVFTEDVPLASHPRYYRPPGDRDKLAAELPTRSAGGIASRYRPSPKAF